MVKWHTVAIPFLFFPNICSLSYQILQSSVRMICLKGCSCFMGLLLPEKFRKISYWLGYLNRFANWELIPYAKCYSIDCCHILEIELICKRNFTGPIQDCNIEVFHYVSLNPHVLQRTFYLFEKIPRGGVLEPRAITPTSVTAFQLLTLTNSIDLPYFWVSVPYWYITTCTEFLIT